MFQSSRQSPSSVHYNKQRTGYAVCTCDAKNRLAIKYNIYNTTHMQCTLCIISLCGGIPLKSH